MHPVDAIGPPLAFVVGAVLLVGLAVAVAREAYRQMRDDRAEPRVAVHEPPSHVTTRRCHRVYDWARDGG